MVAAQAHGRHARQGVHLSRAGCLSSWQHATQSVKVLRCSPEGFGFIIWNAASRMEGASSCAAVHYGFFRSAGSLLTWRAWFSATVPSSATCSCPQGQQTAFNASVRRSIQADKAGKV